jgi:cyclophilin family peptidyl-prolyl cis-trans isomerase
MKNHINRLLRFLAFGILGMMVPTVAMAVAPIAPSNLTAQAINYNTVNLGWTDNSNNEAGFEVQFRVGTTGSFTSLGFADPNQVSVSLTGTAGNTTYQFQIRAVNAAFEYSGFAGPVTVLTPYGVASAGYQAGLLGEAFSFSLTSSNPSLVTSYAVSALPNGLILNPTTGVISGIPTTAGKVMGTVTISHTGGGTASAPLTLRIFRPLPALAAPVANGPMAGQAITLGATGTPISLSAAFSDPDVSSAARLTTDLGNIDYAFLPGTAPSTVANFLGYLSRGDFVNTMFHRSIPGFIIQGGAFRADATASAAATQPPVVNEPDITNVRGTVAMAKVEGVPNSATNQFFINLAENGSNLDNQNEGFTVFARVAGSGMNVADAIAALPTRNYSSVNGALVATPVRGTPPTVYNPAALVRVLSAGVLPILQYSAVSSDPSVSGVSVNGTELSFTPLSAGVCTVTVTATDLDGQSVDSSFPVTINDSYQSWAGRQNFLLPSDADLTADPDKDGAINLMEFALVSPPLGGTAAQITSSVVGGRLQMTFPLRQWMTGKTVTLQSNDDLSGEWTDQWSSAGSMVHPWIVSSTAVNGIITVTARDPDGLYRFLRLKIQN